MRRRQHPGNGRIRTIPWRDDPEVLERVGMVSQMYHEPLTVVLQVVNRALASDGKPAVSYETIKSDRERARELLREEIATGMDEHLVSLRATRLLVHDAMKKAQGAQRAPLLAIDVWITEDMAKLDGSWSAGIVGGAGGMGPAPMPEGLADGRPLSELVAEGKLSPAEHEAYLRARALQAGIKALPPARGPVIEGEARTVEPRPGRRTPKRTAPPTKPPARTRPAPRPEGHGGGQNGASARVRREIARAMDEVVEFDPTTHEEDE